MAVSPWQESVAPDEMSVSGSVGIDNTRHAARVPGVVRASQVTPAWREVAARIQGRAASMRAVSRGSGWIAGVLGHLPEGEREICWIARSEVLTSGKWRQSLPSQFRPVAEEIDFLFYRTQAAGDLASGAPAALQIVDCTGVDGELTSRVVTHLLNSGVATLLKLDPGVAPAILDASLLAGGGTRCRLFDALANDVAASANHLVPDGEYFALLPPIGAEEVLAALSTHIFQMTGIPAGARAIADEVYVRHVEIVTLATLARVGQFPFARASFDRADYDMYARQYKKSNEEMQFSICRGVDVISYPAWKIVCEDRFFVEEIGYTYPLSLFGVEYWADYGGIWSIRKQVPLTSLPKEAGPYFLLGGDTNYYHWLLNWLPRLMALEVFADRGMPRIDAVKILVPATLPPAYLQLLTMLGVPRENILPLADNTVWHFEELIVPSFFYTGRLSPTTAAWYRRKMVTKSDGTNKKRILISRRDASLDRVPRRRVVNEEALMEALSPLGFEAYQLSTLTALEQIKLFQEAEFVVGPHGAGFANMVYSPEDVKAIVLENSWNNTFMADMINVGGGIARVILCEDVIDADIEAAEPDAAKLQELKRSRDMIVDCEAVLKVVRAMLDA